MLATIRILCIRCLCIFTVWIAFQALAHAQDIVLKKTRTELRSDLKLESTITSEEYTTKEFEAIYGKLRFPSYKYGGPVNRVVDSLKASGVDTILEFEKIGNLAPAVSLEIRKKKHRGKIPESWVYPTYLFWKKNGGYYVMKVDRFRVYPAISRERFKHYQLYDFFARNRSELNREEILTTYMDTVEVIRTNASGTAEISKQVIKEQGYAYEPRYEGNFIPLVCSFNLNYWTKGKNYDATYDYSEFQPAGKRTSLDSSYANHISGFNHGAPVANDELNYYRNQSTKIYTWVMLIEREIAEIESRRLWRLDAKKGR